jgi:hypothetical protein
MRCLVTGFSGQQSGRNTLIKYEAVSTVFARGLALAGADVEHRPYSLGENVTEFDAVFLGLVPPFSVAAHFANSALLCLRDAEKAGVPVVIYIDDWHFYQLFSNLKSILKNPLQLVKPFFAGRDLHSYTAEHLDELTAVVERLHTQPWPVTVVPAFTWGDHDKFAAELKLSADVIFTDISALAEEHPAPEPPCTRSRGWVLGTVSNQLEWLESLGLQWPVHHFGGKASRAAAKLPESDLVAEYYRNAGVLSPPYERIIGTGWWRNRFVHAARARSVLLGDPRDAASLDGSYVLDPSKVEAMTGNELAELSAAQHQAFFQAQLPAEEAASLLLNAIAMAKARLS